MHSEILVRRVFDNVHEADIEIIDVDLFYVLVYYDASCVLQVGYILIELRRVKVLDENDCHVRVDVVAITGLDGRQAFCLDLIDCLECTEHLFLHPMMILVYSIADLLPEKNIKDHILLSSLILLLLNREHSCELKTVALV